MAEGAGGVLRGILDSSTASHPKMTVGLFITLNRQEKSRDCPSFHPGSGKELSCQTAGIKGLWKTLLPQKKLFPDDLPPIILVQCEDCHLPLQLALISFCPRASGNISPSAFLPRTLRDLKEKTKTCSILHLPELGTT